MRAFSLGTTKSFNNQLLTVFWLLALIATPIWTSFDTPAWDLAVYVNAIHSLQAGRDPYADAIAVQRLFHAKLALSKNLPPPYSYVYSPITLPILRFFGALPIWLGAAIYGGAYVSGALAQVWAGTWIMTAKEKTYLLYFAPASLFFPGLLQADTCLSGNLAYCVYGAMLLAAVHGWSRGRWTYFYLVVLVASCYKAPFLALLLLPALSVRGQWLKALGTGGLGLLLFAGQPLLSPALFRHYLEAVELQFSFNHDFGCSPAGIIATILTDHGFDYSSISAVAYVIYAMPVFGLLVYLSRLYGRGIFTLRQWVPVLLLGVMLLNPRIKEYDIAPLTLPMALIGWRLCRMLGSVRTTILTLLGFFVIINCIAAPSWDIRTLTSGAALVFLFAVGSWHLIHLSTTTTVANLRASDGL